MNENKCVICRKPIIGYWYEIEKNISICQSCAAVTTVEELYQHDIAELKPDIIEVDSTLVTKEDEDMKNYLSSKQELNAQYGTAIEEMKASLDNNEEKITRDDV